MAFVDYENSNQYLPFLVIHNLLRLSSRCFYHYYSQIELPLIEKNYKVTWNLK